MLFEVMIPLAHHYTLLDEQYSELLEAQLLEALTSDVSVRGVTDSDPVRGVSLTSALSSAAHRLRSGG